MYKFIGVFVFVTIVAANDLTVGLKDEGRKIFDEQRIASPAIWRQTANVTYNASDNEVISGVIVTDLRPDKDGEAKIVEGGQGHKNVTIELKSPTMLRGYDFLIQVYAVSDDNNPISTTEQSELGATDKQDTPNVPISLSGDTLEDNLRKTRKTVDAESSTLKGLDITTVVTSNPSTQITNEQGTPKPHDGEESKKEGVEAPINIGKNVKKDVEVSTTSIITSPTVTLPNDAKVQSDVNKPEVTKSDEDKLKPAIPTSFLHEQFRNTRKSEIPTVEENDDAPISTSLPEHEVSTESSSTIETDATTLQSSTDIVTVVDTLEAVASKKDISVPKVLVSEDSEHKGHRFEVPIPYNH